MPPGLHPHAWMEGRASRKDPLEVRDEYSSTLNKVLEVCTRSDPDERPDAASMVQHIKKAIKHEEVRNPETPEEEMPPWAMRIHDYHGRKSRQAWPYTPPGPDSNDYV